MRKLQFIESTNMYLKLNSNVPLPLEPIALEFPQLVAIVPPSHRHNPGLIHLPVGPQRFEEQIGTKHRPVDPL